MRLTLAGAALTALLGSLTTAVLLLDQRTLEQVRFWLAGSVAGRDLHLMLQSLPYIGFGLVLALLLGGQITLQTLGEEVASGLGQRTTLVKALSTLAVVMLAGGAVAVAGPVGFVGLVIPHVGALLRWRGLPVGASLLCPRRGDGSWCCPTWRRGWCCAHRSCRWAS